jgi:predicted P-loop ATPase
VFLGTTNKNEFLHDETGARRYWPVQVVSIDLDWLRENRDQLFAEAKACFDKGENWWPTVQWEEQWAKPVQEKHQESDDAWEEAISRYVEEYQVRVKTTEIFLQALGFKDIKDIKMADHYRLRKIMIRLGWECFREHEGRFWHRRKK